MTAIHNIYEKMTNAMEMFWLSPMARNIRSERLTYLSLPKLRRLERILLDLDAHNVAGDYVEFGVALGGSSILIAQAARKGGRTFTGFDVFGTIPKPASPKDDAKSKERYKAIAEGKSEGIRGDHYYGYREDLYGDVIRAFYTHGLTVDSTTVALEKGLFEETWPKWKPRALAFAHIDCDWYDPVRYCLNVTYDLLAPGGMILLDDYHDYSGAETATREFLAEHAGITLEDGPNVILRRGNPNPNTKGED